MPADSCDVIVVGGGPAGSVLSLLLGRRGYVVELYEQAAFPRDKACGEGLLPPGVELLRELDLLDLVGGVPIGGVRYHVGGGSVRAGFAPGAEGGARWGLGQRRLHFDHALWKAAEATHGVVTHSGTAIRAPLTENGQVTGVVTDEGVRRARLVVAADGASSTMRRKLGLEQVLAPRRMGIRAHYRRPHGSAPLHDIQVFLRDGYEIYITPLPDDEVLVAALTRDAGDGNLRHQFLRWMSEERELVTWLDGATQSSQMMGRAPLLTRVRQRQVPPGLVFLGDAAESVDPVTAGGMTLALIGASLLERHIDGIVHGRAQSRRAFATAQQKAVRVHRWLGAGLRLLGRLPLAARGAKAWIDFHPATMDALLALAATRPVT